MVNKHYKIEQEAMKPNHYTIPRTPYHHEHKNNTWALIEPRQAACQRRRNAGSKMQEADNYSRRITSGMAMHKKAHTGTHQNARSPERSLAKSCARTPCSGPLCHLSPGWPAYLLVSAFLSEPHQRLSLIRSDADIMAPEKELTRCWTCYQVGCSTLVANLAICIPLAQNPDRWKPERMRDVD